MLKLRLHEQIKHTLLAQTLTEVIHTDTKFEHIKFVYLLM